MQKPQTVTEMEKLLPDSEDERTEEARWLINHIEAVVSMDQLTSWEMQTVSEIKEGKAATSVRLRELRNVAKRLAHG